MNKTEAENVIKDTIEYANGEIEKSKRKTRFFIIGAVIITVLVVIASIVLININTRKFEDVNITAVREYSQKADGAWVCEGNTYKYKLVISGRMPNAVCDSTFVYLSNDENITLEQAWKAAGFSSNFEDYFNIKDAVLVGISTQ